VGAESAAVGEHDRILADVAWLRPACYVPAMTDGLRRLTDEEKVIRAFIRDGRLASIPAKPSKRELLLPYVVDTCFPEDREYEEREVNQRWALLHPDVAALRRYLVDGGLMTRDAGVYRRSAPMAVDRRRPDPWPVTQPPRGRRSPEGDGRA
jgi:hypothetical protein